MIITDLFNLNAHLHVVRAVDSDIWLRTEGPVNSRFRMGGSVRVRTWAGGGYQEESLEALNAFLSNDDQVLPFQLTLAHEVPVRMPDIDKAERRFIVCDDERGNYAELFRMNTGLHGVRTVSEDRNWTGPIVWVTPKRGIPMSYEQSLFKGLFKSAFKERPANNLRAA